MTNNTTDTPVAAPIVPGTPEYDAAMIAKFDKHSGVTGSEPAADQAIPPVERPAHIPEKFWDAEKGEVRVEALAKSYAELEKGKAPVVVAPKDALKVDTPDVAPEAAAEVLADAGLNFDDFSTEFQNTGALSEESYKKLEGANIPKAMVDAYIAGQQALATQWENAGYSAAGGQEQYNQMTQWAITAMSQPEKVAFNDAVSKGDEAQMKLAIGGLRQRFESENGKTPQLRGGGNSQAATGYQSRAQMTADIRNPLYAKDPAFRKQVEAKIAVSNV